MGNVFVALLMIGKEECLAIIETLMQHVLFFLQTSAFTFASLVLPFCTYDAGAEFDISGHYHVKRAH